jgi:hypothetical protein
VIEPDVERSNALCQPTHRQEIDAVAAMAPAFALARAYAGCCDVEPAVNNFATLRILGNDRARRGRMRA